MLPVPHPRPAKRHPLSRRGEHTAALMAPAVCGCAACSHPEEESAKPKNEADMMAKICAYLDRLFQVVKPQRVCFMAIDGCAPRAKMNQQRARRFRAAQERKEMEDKERMMVRTLPADQASRRCRGGRSA
jgi:hypothetical protein